MKKGLNKLAIGIWLLALFFTIINFTSLPSEVPTHYNILGEVDGWGDKTFIFFFPLLSIGVWFLFQLAEKRPQFINMPGFNFENATELQIESVRGLVNILKNTTVIFLSLMSSVEVFHGLGFQFNLTPWDMIIYLVVMSITLIYYYFKNAKLKKVSID